MNRLVLALSILMISLSAVASESKIEESYSAETIKQASINSVADLISYAAKEHSALKGVNTDAVLFLKNGQRTDLTPQQQNDAIANAKTIQVMGSGSSLVINVITV